MSTLVGLAPRPAKPAARRTQSAAPAAPGIWVESVAAQNLPHHQAAWANLADNALESNCFYEPWSLLPAVKYFGQRTRLVFALVYRRTSPGGNAELCGLFPFERVQRVHGLPMSALKLWKHVHCFLCTPLVHRVEPAATIAALIDWAGSQGESVLEFEGVHAAGPFAESLIDVLNEKNLLSFAAATFNRAALIPGADEETYLRASGLSSSHRRELKRLRRRLGDLGKLETRVLQPADDVADWLEHFLRLEGSGWKGQQQTALTVSPAERTFFIESASAAHRAGKLLMLGLFLDGKPIALKCNFRAGAGVFAFKIAYDEQYEKYSPGVQLELDNIAAAHAQPAFAWMDSCAASGHFMINRLWRERRSIQHLIIAAGDWRGQLMVGALPLLRAVKRIVTAVVKRKQPAALGGQ